MPEISVRFEPRDLWIGVYWDRVGYATRVYVCLVPCFPILFKWRKPDE